MQDIGRYLGTVLGPRGKMPTPLQPDDDVVETVNRMKNTVQLRSRDRRTFHTRVGAEDMGADAISDNIDVIVRRLEANLEKGPLNIDGIYVKTTMGPAKEVPV
jgi:large subunit ribosomal protein L1